MGAEHRRANRAHRGLSPGLAYARSMQDTAQALAQALHGASLPVYASARGATRSHQFAIRAAR